MSYPKSDCHPANWDIVLREAAFAHQLATLTQSRLRAAEETLADIDGLLQDDDFSGFYISLVLHGYQAQVRLIYKEHQRAIQRIKDMYPNSN